MVTALIERGADVNAVPLVRVVGLDSPGTPPLEIAVRTAQTDMVRLLLHHGADVNSAATFRWRPYSPPGERGHWLSDHDPGLHPAYGRRERWFHADRSIVARPRSGSEGGQPGRAHGPVSCPGGQGTLTWCCCWRRPAPSNEEGRSRLTRARMRYVPEHPPEAKDLANEATDSTTMGEAITLTADEMRQHYGKFYLASPRLRLGSQTGARRALATAAVRGVLGTCGRHRPGAAPSRGSDGRIGQPEERLHRRPNTYLSNGWRARNRMIPGKPMNTLPSRR